MGTPPLRHPLGRIDLVIRDPSPAFSQDVALDLPTIQRAWPTFENLFDSLQGRRFLGLVDETNRRYHLCCLRLERDIAPPAKLVKTIVPGGPYLRLRLKGEPPAIYERIGAAFDVLADHTTIDLARPMIEEYRSAHRVDCLLPTTDTDL